jgi:general secretion pathway protein G
MHMRVQQMLRSFASGRARTSWRDARGWTLLELVIVMALIVILAGIATAQHRNAVTRTKEAVLKENLFRMRDAIDQYYADKNRYPADLQALVSDQYIREVPEDPFTTSNSSWQTVPAEADPSNPSIDVGIYNVKSGSSAQALDGTNYADW